MLAANVFLLSRTVVFTDIPHFKDCQNRPSFNTALFVYAQVYHILNNKSLGLVKGTEVCLMAGFSQEEVEAIKRERLCTMPVAAVTGMIACIVVLLVAEVFIHFGIQDAHQ